MIYELIKKDTFDKPFLNLITSKNSKNRLKGLNTLKILFEQYKEVNKTTNLLEEGISIVKLVLICLKKGLENEKDSKLQFNALLILDQLF